MERDKNCSSLLYGIWEELNSFFSFETRKEMYPEILLFEGIILLVENDVKKLAWYGFDKKKLIIDVLHRLPRHLCSNF